jgi:Ca2+-binding EF-hand superfamily protein
MNRSLLLTISFFAAALSPTLADDKPPQPSDQAKALAEFQQKIIQQFDLNKDGALSEQEQLAAQEAMRKQGWPGFGMAPGGFTGSEQFVKQFDRDGDGKLSDQEKMMAMAAYQRLRGTGSGGRGYVHLPPLPGMAGSMGVAPPGPQSTGSPAQPDKKTGKVAPLIKRFDKDGDGKLNDEEKATAQAELKGKNKKTAK